MCLRAIFREPFPTAFFWDRDAVVFTVQPCVRPTLRLPDRLSDHPSVRPSDRPTVRLTDRPSDRPSDRPTVRLTDKCVLRTYLFEFGLLGWRCEKKC